jgi:CBS domain-containing protein
MRIDVLHPLTSARLAVVATDATVRTAAIALSRPDIGLLVVCDENRSVTGVVSKSDLVRHLACAGEIAAPVMDLMSRNIVSCGPDDDVHATWQSMAAQSLQNMPILGADARPLVILDIRDALKVLFEQEEYQEQLFFKYIAGIGYQ